MTLPQIWNALYEGKVPRPGRKSFATSLEARQWREQEAARIAAAEWKARYDAHKARRKLLRGF